MTANSCGDIYGNRAFGRKATCDGDIAPNPKRLGAADKAHA